MAYFLDLNRRYKTMGLYSNAVRLEDKSSFNTVDYICKKVVSEKGVRGRRADFEYINRNMWQRIDTDSYVILSLPHTPDVRMEGLLPTDDNDPVSGARPLRGTISAYLKLKGLSDVETKIEYVSSHGSSLPAKRQAILVTEDMTIARISQEYFLKQRQLADLDEADGRALGLTFALNDRHLRVQDSRAKRIRQLRTDRIKRESHVESTILLFASLKEFSHLYRWFPSLIFGMLDNWLYDPKVIQTKFENLSSVEARYIGRSLSKALKARKTAEAGVDQWLLNYPALVECCGRHPFFLPLCVSLAQQKLIHAPWGLKFRVLFGATISVADVVTDIYAINMFWRTGRSSYAIANLAMVLCAMLMQVLLMFIQYRRRGPLVILRESLIVLSNMKPAVDAYRICSGKRGHAEDLFEPLAEMAYSKCIDMFGENIPGGVLQLYAYAVSDKSGAGPLISILVSLLSTAYTSTILSLDLDTNPDSRKRYPSLYGYVPDDSSRRQMCFLFTFCICFSQVSMRSIFAALVLSVGPQFMGLYIAGDICLYLLIKLLRSDLRYSLNLSGSVSWVASLFVRVGIKMIVDFTCIFHFRSPFEMGGLVWTMSIFVSHALLHAAGHLYSELYDGANKMPYSLLMPVLVGFELFFVLSFAGFILYMNRAFLGTFYSSFTGPQFACWRFMTSTSDEATFEIFACHPAYYESIRDEVVSWITQEQDKWELDRPAWLDDRKLAMIPPSLRKKGMKEAIDDSKVSPTAVKRSNSFGGAEGVGLEDALKEKYKNSLNTPKRLTKGKPPVVAPVVTPAGFLRRLSTIAVSGPDMIRRISDRSKPDIEPVGGGSDGAASQNPPGRRGSVMQSLLRLSTVVVPTSLASKAGSGRQVEEEEEEGDSSSSDEELQNNDANAERERRRLESHAARQEMKQRSNARTRKMSNFSLSYIPMDNEEENATKIRREKILAGKDSRSAENRKSALVPYGSGREGSNNSGSGSGRERRSALAPTSEGSAGGGSGSGSERERASGPESRAQSVVEPAVGFK